MTTPRSHLSTYLSLLKSFDTLSLPDKESLLLTPIAKGTTEMLKFSIERNKSGFNKLYPKYTLFYQLPASPNPIPLLVSKKRSGQTTSNYMISLNIQNPKPKGQGFIGKVRSSGNGCYNCYGKGGNPSTSVKEGMVRR